MKVLWKYKAGTTNLVFEGERKLSGGEILDELEGACYRKHKIILDYTRQKLIFSSYKSIKESNQSILILCFRFLSVSSTILSLRPRWLLRF